jgi:hypothetical protein
MNFVLVNDGQPSHESACSACARPLRSGYVRHVPTREGYVAMSAIGNTSSAPC